MMMYMRPAAHVFGEACPDRRDSRVAGSTASLHSTAIVQMLVCYQNFYVNTLHGAAKDREM